MWSTLLQLLIFHTLLCAIIAQLTCPSFDGRSQLRPYNTDLLISIQDLQYDFEARYVTEPINCKPELPCVESKYRTADGSCNNLQNTRWGKSMECVNRIAAPIYADGSRAPKVAKSGNQLPSARLISTVVHSQVASDEDVSHMLMQWGQFVVHDVTLAPTSQQRAGIKDCCTESNSECFPITIPSNDPFYSQFNRQCMTFVRTVPCLTCTMFREQINGLTSFVDASNVYGSMENETSPLRRFDGTGKLKSQTQSGGFELLPQSLDPASDQCSNPSIGKICFAAGDNRANVLPTLTAMHTIFMREHNRLCDLLKILNPGWDEETLFQEARRIVGAEIQMITYNEFLPKVLGPITMTQWGLYVNFGRTVYDPNVNPTLYNEFSTAAFRFGHTMIFGQFHRITATGETIPYFLRDNYFNPSPLYEGQLDQLNRGLTGKPAERFDPFVTDDVRNFLFRNTSDPFGNDLPAFNIQRGRDHAIPGYTYFVYDCHKVRIINFFQLELYMPSQQWTKYAQLYESVDDIDLFSGLISERKSVGALIGPTTSCIVGKQFHNLKYGDRFWFEHSGQSGSFTDAQLSQIRRTTLASIICLNGDNFGSIQAKALERDTGTFGFNPIKPCDAILAESNIDLNPWKV